jgi:hypothetical protein
MRTFTVRWHPDALLLLAEAWMRANDRNAVTAAQAAVDRFLGDDPTQFGVEVSEGLWRIKIPPLMVYYTIDTVDLVVSVTAVGSC